MHCICGGGSPDNHSIGCLVQEAAYHNPDIPEEELEAQILAEEAEEVREREGIQAT